MIKCIVVEDLAPLREAFCTILEDEADMMVAGAFESGDALLGWLEGKTQPADVVLLDIEMRMQKEGISVCRTLNQRWPCLKVVMLTCHEEEDFIVQSLEAGAVDYLSKNSSPDQIVAMVRDAMRGVSSFDSLVSGTVRRHLRSQQDFRQSMLYCLHIVSRLTASEQAVMKLLLQNKSKREIASIRVVEYGTVKLQTRNILKKLGCARVSDLQELARQNNLEELLGAVEEEAGLAN